MPDGDAPQFLAEPQWKQIKDAVDAAIRDGLETPKKLEEMRIQVSRIVSHMDSDRRVDQYMSDMLHDHNRALYGTGDTTGLRGKVNRLADFGASIEDHQKAIYGSGDKLGLQATVNTLVNAHSQFMKLLWIVVTLGVGLLGATVYNIILQYGKG